MKGCSVRELSEAAQCSAVRRSAAAQLDSTELRALLDGLPAALLGTSVGAAVIGALLPDPLPEPPLVLSKFKVQTIILGLLTHQRADQPT